MRRITPWVVMLWATAALGPPALADWVDPITDPVTGNQEWRVFDDPSGQHYLSVIQTPAGAIAVRPHPGDDPNGWGSTPYVNIRQQGDRVGGQVDAVVPESSGIHLSASGPVTTVSDTNGQWTSNWTFSYEPSAQSVSGAGETLVSLYEPLAVGGTDLTVADIASNRLRNVPLVGGGTGDTGDMSLMHVTSPTWNYTWDPLVQGSSFPQDLAADLTLTMVGEYNRVDGPALGEEWIEPAYKPTITIGVEAVTPGLQMITGGYFDESQDTNPYADNVAGLAVVRHQDFAGLELELAYAYQSVPVPEPGTAILAMIGCVSILVMQSRRRCSR